MNVLLAAPPGALRDRVVAVLHELSPKATVTYWTDPVAALADAKAPKPPALVILSIDSPADDGAAAVARCARRWPRAPVVVAGDDRDPALIDSVFEAGAAGYLPQHYTAQMMQNALRLVLDGSGFRPAATPAPSAAEGEAPDSGNPYGLTERQMEVLSLAAQAKTNHAIGAQLGIAEGTVKLHMNAIFKALNVASRSEAILVAARLPNLRKLQIERAEDGGLDLEWLLPHMTHRRLPKGSRLFSQGDPGRELYYLQRGTVRLPEIDATLGPGELFGEIGIFSPTHLRTCSAVCETEVDLFSLSAEQVKQIYYLNPHFAFYVVNLIAKRLMADRERTV